MVQLAKRNPRQIAETSQARLKRCDAKLGREPERRAELSELRGRPQERLIALLEAEAALAEGQLHPGRPAVRGLYLFTANALALT